MNYLWAGMILIGVVYGAFTGNLTAVTKQALNSAGEAVTLCITMAGVMAFWVGLMEIAQQAGIIRGLSARLDPVLSFLFPDIPKGHKAREAIATNVVANFFGLGWAATPAGLSAMKELKKLQKPEDTDASDAMCDFLILNISSLQFIPVNMIAYRSQYGSVNPSRIVGPAIVATTISTAAAIIFMKIRRGLAK
ncbi:nucleoside recognition protein [Roseburia sp. MUC/MUC-530-WT-4D]|uniref:Nucleoside recognition protein n=1 Tax=Roseburia porci TaxID=2605790 RepID=A0A6L5YNM0_9FIRM|nr:nucleoside recognition protein [Roseburia porci]MCI5517002.1 nucleoside recognition protein [Roseburia sp.]MST73692.1 nucleoside recognition protein [Roseburia porci]